MANQFLNAQEYANVMLLHLTNNLVMGNLVDGQFKKDTTDENGLSTSVKRPPKFVVRTGATRNANDIVTGSANVTVDQYKGVDVDIGDLEAVQSFNQLMNSSTMKSAASTLAHNVDSFLSQKLLGFYGSTGTAGTTIGSPQQFNSVHTQLMAQGVPNSDLSAVVGFADGEAIRGDLIDTNIQGTNRAALRKTSIPILSEIDLYATQGLPTYTSGTRAQTGESVINGASQNVNYRDVKNPMTQTLNIDGLTSGETVAAGEVFTIAGVFSYDNRHHQTLAALQKFTVVTGDTANGSGEVALTVAPPIIVQGTTDGTDTKANTAFGSVNAAPADGAAIVYMEAPSTTIRVRSAFHKRAISLVSAQLKKPFSDTSSFAHDPKTGISIRYWRGSSISDGTHMHRWDMIYGAEVMDRELGARMAGTP